MSLPGWIRIGPALIAGMIWAGAAGAQDAGRLPGTGGLSGQVEPGQDPVVLPPAGTAPVSPSATPPAAPPPAWSAGTRLVVVNVKMLLEESRAARSLQQQLDAQKETLARDMNAQQDRLSAAEQELANLRKTAAPEEFDRRRSEFEREVMATSRATQDRTRRLDAAFNQGRNQLLEALRDVVAQVAGERGATVVISSQFVLYQTDRSVDITDAVMQRLNAKLPTITVHLPQQ